MRRTFSWKTPVFGPPPPPYKNAYRSDITSKVRIERLIRDILRRDFNKIEGGQFEDKIISTKNLTALKKIER